MFLSDGPTAYTEHLTPPYVRFATHYRFRPDFCHAADPESKGIVENLVGYAKDDLLVPLELDDDPWAGGLAGLNERAVAWCEEVNAAVHSEIHAVPVERLATEAELLGELPSLRLEVGSKPISRKVDKLSCIRFGSARYSVPNRLIGTTVTVLVDERDRVLRGWSRSPARSTPSTSWSRQARSASTMATTTAHGPPRRVGEHAPGRL